MKIEPDTKLDFSDVLIRPKRSSLSSRQNVKLTKRFHFLHSNAIEQTVPIWVANMDTTGTLEMAKAFQHCIFDDDWQEEGVASVAIDKHVSLEDWESVCFDGDRSADPEYPLRAGNMSFTCGISKHNMEALDDILELNSKTDLGLRYVCLDVANGYNQVFIDCVRRVRNILDYTRKQITLIAGNVVTREMTEALILAGADVVKVGIGSGSACTTRKVAGVGYPQLSAVAECADAAHGLGGHIMSDGGCQTPGDVSKAFAAGADFVMVGGMMAGHDESRGDCIYDTASGEITHKTFYGMSSTTAMQKYSGGVASYRASEGRTVRVPYRGPAKNTLQSIMGGVRSACTYVGAKSLKDLPKCASFVRVNNQYNRVYENATIDE